MTMKEDFAAMEADALYTLFSRLHRKGISITKIYPSVQITESTTDSAPYTMFLDLAHRMVESGEDHRIYFGNSAERHGNAWVQYSNGLGGDCLSDWSDSPWLDGFNEVLLNLPCFWD